MRKPTTPPAATKVLVVEDDDQLRALLGRGLTDEGYQVTLVADGRDALAQALAAAPQIVVLDIMLPGMSGFEVCTWLRAYDASIGILMLTARDGVDDRVRGLDIGADDYLVKPFAFNELTARLRALRRRELAAPQTRLEAGGVVLDVLDRTVTVQGEPLHLSPKEFALLRMLLANAGACVTRQHILTELSGSAAHIDPNVVDQYVSYLRRKLDRVDAQVKIVTQRGVGFRLDLR